jgi:hypothetical protein
MTAELITCILAALLLLGCAASPAGTGPAPVPKDLATPAPSDLACMPSLDAAMSGSEDCGGCGPCPMGVDRIGGTPYFWSCCGSCGIQCTGELCQDWECR